MAGATQLRKQSAVKSYKITSLLTAFIPLLTGASEATGNVWVSAMPGRQVFRNTFKEVEKSECLRPSLGGLLNHLLPDSVTISNFSVVSEDEKK